MNLLFWKKKKPAEGESKDESLEKPDEETTAAESEEAERTPVQPGILARVRTKLVAARQRLRRHRESPAPAEDQSPVPAEDQSSAPAKDQSPASAKGKSPAAKNAPGKATVEAPTADATTNIPASKVRKRSLLWGTVVVLTLLTAGGGFAAIKWLLAPAPADMQAQIEALKKQNQEMQAQIEAQKKESQSKPKPVTAAEENKAWGTTPLSDKGVLVISNEDSKASAQTLKQAIEEMNAASEKRRTAKKPAQ